MIGNIIDDVLIPLYDEWLFDSFSLNPIPIKFDKNYTLFACQKNSIINSILFKAKKNHMKKIDILKRKISPRALFCIPNDWLHFISKKNVAKLFVWNRNWFDALCLPMMTPKLKFEILLLSMFKSDGDIQETETHSDGTSIRLNILSSQRQTKWKNERKEKKNAHRFNNSIKKILSNEIFPHYLSLVRKNQLCIWLDVLTCHKQWRQFGFALRRTSIYSSMGTNECKQSVNLIGFLCHAFLHTFFQTGFLFG